MLMLLRVNQSVASANTRISKVNSKSNKQNQMQRHTKNAPIIGTEVLLTTSNGEILAIPAQAIMTTEMRDMERPMEAAKFMGSSMATKKHT